MWKTSLTKHEKVGWNRYFVKKLSTQKQSAYKSVKSYVFVWIKLVKKFLNFSLLTRTRLNCYERLTLFILYIDIITTIDYKGNGCTHDSFDRSIHLVT